MVGVFRAAVEIDIVLYVLLKSYSSIRDQYADGLLEGPTADLWKGRWHISLPPTKLDTILIVDDDCEASERWAKGLQSCSPQYTVLTTDSVQSALDLCHCQKMACVVLDLDMNHASGFEVGRSADKVS
jgi:hypothetical protein